MSHERLKHVKENLLSSIENQVCNLYEVDSEELGNAIDMLKDLEEALYYCTITEAMEGKGEQPSHSSGRDMMYYTEYEPKYYSSPSRVSSSNGYNNGGRDYGDSSEWEGRSPQSRRMYMEAKEQKRDKTVQLRELERYMQELTQDMVEMIQDTSSEEKQYLEKKITALASKIGQMK